MTPEQRATITRINRIIKTNKHFGSLLYAQINGILTGSLSVIAPVNVGLTWLRTNNTLTMAFRDTHNGKTLLLCMH